MNNLEELKKIYLNTRTQNQSSWEELRSKLDPLPPSRAFIFRPAYILASLVVFLGFVTATAQAAGPGDALYPVRILSDQIQAKITQKPEVSVEKRTQDIIKASDKNSPEKVEKAVDEFNKAVDQGEKSLQQDSQREQFKADLNNQQQKLEEVKDKNPDVSDKIDKAIQKSEKAQGEIKGVSTKKTDK